MTGKKYPQIKLQRFQKVGIWTSNRYIKSTLDSDSSILYSPFNFSKHWLLKGRFCIEILRFQSYYFQLKKRYSCFLKKGFDFQKICCKVIVLKSFKICSDYHKSMLISQMDSYFENP